MKIGDVTDQFIDGEWKKKNKKTKTTITLDIDSYQLINARQRRQAAPCRPSLRLQHSIIDS